MPWKETLWESTESSVCVLSSYISMKDRAEIGKRKYKENNTHLSMDKALLFKFNPPNGFVV